MNGKDLNIMAKTSRGGTTGQQNQIKCQENTHTLMAKNRVTHATCSATFKHESNQYWVKRGLTRSWSLRKKTLLVSLNFTYLNAIAAKFLNRNNLGTAEKVGKFSCGIFNL